jgi:hypothetical protein
VQVEIPIPSQPARVTLHRARVIRDQLERELHHERPAHATAVTQIALRFDGADKAYREIRPSFYRRRKLDQLHIVACFIAALERKR